MHIPIFGNGDVNSPEKAALMRDEFGLDGAMIGRASIGNPWFFKQVKHFFKTGMHLPEITIAERVAVARRHLQMEIDWKVKEIVGIMEMRRHYTNYFRGIPHFKPYRLKLVTTDSLEELNLVFEEILEVFG